MPPKVKTQQEKIQAVVLTDSFEENFTSQPKCLLPLVGAPLIEYTLEFLNNSPITEIFIIVTNEKVYDYLVKSKWKINIIMSMESKSIGDVMRDIDNRGIISGDFLFVTGDIITNINFNKLWSYHKSKKLDKDYMMTIALSNSKTKFTNSIFILENQSNKCIYYQDYQKTIDIDPELIEDGEFIIRNDLVDCHIDICSPLVPQIFQENFDYQELRSDFLKGVLTSDILRKTIYIYQTDSYSARVYDWNTYDSISKDILARWCFPIVPDSNLFDTSYVYEFNNIYKEDKILLAESCKIGTSTAIGRNTTIGEGTSIKNSVIGRNCKIGKNCKISNSYIWDDSVVEDNTILNKNLNQIPLNFYKLTINGSDDSIASLKKKRNTRRRLSTNSIISEPEEDFSIEGFATVSRAIENNHDIDTALLELNTLRMSMNVNYHEVRSVTSEAIIKKIIDYISTETLKPQEATTKLFSNWGQMFKRQTFGNEDEIDLLNILELEIEELNSNYNQIILFVAIKTLYDIEIIQEDNILKWWDLNENKAGDVRGLTSKFITWLKEAEEDSDDD
ncbi:GCD6 [Candida pseudojiufengensis]|uniref:GCD6 n=1 Tax=Candida pseudojiufengensis TaxID=497109 RepID=UPI002224D771|nr:GCD6 [Candida pseudojiufengensis]KAI5960158.1 GCD6 [Candida pseudojiufengensis]